MSDAPILALDNVSKVFGEVYAARAVSFALQLCASSP